MKQLTDSMIESALQDSPHMTSGDIPLLIVIMVGFTIFCGAILYFSKSTRQRIGAGGTLIMMLVMGSILIYREASMMNAINRGDWEVHTDIVARVMESTSNDGKDYYMVLREYGRESLKNRREAKQYYSGQEVYVIVVRKGNNYEQTGLTYPADIYEYVGDH